MSDGMEVRRTAGRFAMVHEWLLDAGVSSHAIRLFATMDAKYADRVERRCWPSRSTLAKQMQVSRSTIDRAMTELQDVGAVRVTRRRDDRNEWTSSLYELAGETPFGVYLAPPVGQGPPTGGDQSRSNDPESIVPAPVPRDSLADRSSTPGDQAVDDVYDQALSVLTAAIDWAEAVDGDARPQLRRQVVASVAVAIARRPHDHAAAIAALVATHVDGPDRDTVDTTWPHRVDPRPTMHAWSTALQTCAHPPVASAP